MKFSWKMPILIGLTFACEFALAQAAAPVVVYSEDQTNSQLWIQQRAEQGYPRLAVLMLRDQNQRGSWSSFIPPHTIDVFSTHAVDPVRFGLFALRSSSLGAISLVADQSVYLAQELDDGRTVLMTAVSTSWGATPAPRFQFERIGLGDADQLGSCKSRSPTASRRFRAEYEDKSGTKVIEAVVTSSQSGLQVLEVKASHLEFPFLFDTGNLVMKNPNHPRFEIVNSSPNWPIGTLRRIETTLTLEDEASSESSMFVMCSNGPQSGGRRVNQMLIFVPGLRGSAVRLEEVGP